MFRLHPPDSSERGDRVGAAAMDSIWETLSGPQVGSEAHLPQRLAGQREDCVGAKRRDRA